jgi:hypothetical protein
MIRPLRAFFLSRLLREKLLLVGFAGIAVLIWGSGFSTRAGLFWKAQRTTTGELRLQEEWLHNEKRITETAEKAAGQLDPAKTLDGTRLFAAVRQLAQDAGLRNYSSPGLSPPVTNGQLSIHTLQFQVNNADWDGVKKFYLLLNQRAPYLAVDQFILSPNRANPAQLTLTLKVKSVEVTR